MPVDASFSLIPDAPSAGSDSAAAQLPRELSPFASFIGYGLTAPFQRGASDFVAATGSAFIKSMILEVLGVRAGSDFTDGELPWRPEFGSLLHILRHRKNDAVTGELARVYVGEALARWIPQVRLKSVITEKADGPPGQDKGTVLLVRISYDIIGLNRPGNEVLIPNETLNIPIAA